MRVFNIKKFHQVSHERQAALRRQKLIPISEDYLDSSFDISSLPAKGDWIIEYYDGNHPIILSKVRDHKRLPYKHLYIKHFIRIESYLKIDVSSLAPLLRFELDQKKHLEVFTDEAVYVLLKQYANRLKPKNNKKKSGTKIQTPRFYQKEILIDPVQVTGAISKAALEAYIKNHEGRLPTLREFENIKNNFGKSGKKR